MLQIVTSDNFYDFVEKLKSCRINYLPMIAGTLKAAREQSDWLETYDDRYLWLIDDIGDGQWCLYVLKKAPPALWLSAVLPSDWPNRFEILGASFPRLIDWFRARENDQYLYGQIDGPDAPLTMLESFLPIFLRNGMKPEYSMWMVRDGNLPVPDEITCPDEFTMERYPDHGLDELASLVSDVFQQMDVDFSLDDARSELLEARKHETFHDSAVLVRDESGRLAGAYYSVISSQPDVGELVVRQEYQGMGLGRFLFNEAIRFIALQHPGQDIRLGTCREWTRAVRLYERYGFEPAEKWTYLSLNKDEAG